MAADIDELVALLRVDLRDEDEGTQRWPDESLERHLQRVAGELSQVLPRQLKDTLATSPGSRLLDVTDLEDYDALVRLEAVEYPVDQSPRRFVQWSLWGEELELLIDATPAGVEDVAVYYSALHVVDGEGSTVPAHLDGLVVTGAAGYAAVEWASFATNRANVAGAGAVRDYAAWGQLRLEDFRAGLRNLRRVRSSRLYTPADPAPGQSVVQWDP